jgi:hypothetical protein
MFQFGRLAHLAVQYIFNVLGCPIRKSSDLMLVCSSPKLIAAYHVLHRLSDPRHSPYALNCFKNLKYIYSAFLHCIKLLLLVTTYLFPICQRTYIQLAVCNLQKAMEFVDVMDLNQHTAFTVHLIFFKNYLLIAYCNLLTNLWRISESNRWPSACKADALANWANPPNWVVSFQLAAISCEVSQLLTCNLKLLTFFFCRPVRIWTGDPYIISVVL